MTAMNFVDTQVHGTSFPSTYVAPGTLQWFGVSATQGSTTGTLPASPPSGVYGSNTYTLLAASCTQTAFAETVAGYFTSNNALTVIPVGFAPSRVTVFNDTDGILWEWVYGMAATHTMKTTTVPAFTNDTGSAIVVTADSAGGQGNVAYVALSATLCGNSKTIAFRIEK